MEETFNLANYGRHDLHSTIIFFNQLKYFFILFMNFELSKLYFGVNQKKIYTSDLKTHLHQLKKPIDNLILAIHFYPVLINHTQSHDKQGKKEKENQGIQFSISLPGIEMRSGLPTIDLSHWILLLPSFPPL